MIIQPSDGVPIVKNNVWLLSYLFAGLVVSGCATTRNDNTLASLGEKLKLKIDKNTVVVSARAKAMENYWDFMNSAPKDSLSIEAMRRLADLELERSEEQMQMQMERMSQLPIENQVPIDVTENSFDKAISLYENALKVSKERDGAEDRAVLYQLAKAYEQIGIPEKTLETLNRLLTQHPDVENRDEIHFRRGEMLFQLGNFRLAELAYTQSMVIDPSSPYFEKSLSKKGWATYKQNKYDKALYSFLQLINRKLRDNEDQSGTTEVLTSAGDKELVKDLFRVVVLCFDEMGGVKKINSYFEISGHRGYEKRIYRDLADRYTEQGRMRDAAESYKEFVNIHPDHPQAPEFDLLAIEAYGKGGFANLVFQAKIDFVQRYRVGGEFWSRHGAEVQGKLMPVLARNMEDIARHYHARSQQTKLAEDYAEANRWYRNYIESFPKTEKSAELNFLLAETLFENKQFELAVTEYERTAYQYTKGPKTAEAGYAALVAYAELVKMLEGDQKQEKELTAIESALRFGKTFPEDSRTINVITKAAEDLFALKQYGQAADAARTLVELKGGLSDAKRRTAWLIVAQSEFQAKEYAHAESAYRAALPMAENDEAIRNVITNGLAASIYKLGEQFKTAGKLKEAVEQFSRIAEVAPGSEINTKAEFDIAMNLVLQKDWPQAIEKLQAFRRNHPGDRLQSNITENLAAAFLEIDNPLQAAEELEILYITQQDPEEKRKMLWQIAGLYEKAEEDSKIIDAYRRYVGRYNMPLEQAIEGRQKLADVYARIGDNDKQVYWLEEIIKNDSGAGTSSSARTRYLAAKATFVLAGPQLEMFKSVQLVAPLKANLSAKKKRMKEAVDAYTRAANYGVAEVTTASVYRLAEIYGSFGQELMKSERPEGLGPEELEQYNILLEEQAFPFEEKSINIHESNIEQVKDGNYNEWIKKSFAALGALRPVRYAKKEKSELVANAIY